MERRFGRECARARRWRTCGAERCRARGGPARRPRPLALRAPHRWDAPISCEGTSRAKWNKNPIGFPGSKVSSLCSGPGSLGPRVPESWPWLHRREKAVLLRLRSWELLGRWAKGAVETPGRGVTDGVLFQVTSLLYSPAKGGSFCLELHFLLLMFSDLRTPWRVFFLHIFKTISFVGYNSSFSLA